MESRADSTNSVHIIDVKVCVVSLLFLFLFSSFLITSFLVKNTKLLLLITVASRRPGAPFGIISDAFLRTRISNKTTKVFRLLVHDNFDKDN